MSASEITPLVYNIGGIIEDMEGAPAHLIAEAILNSYNLQTIREVLQLVRHARGAAGHACSQLTENVLLWVIEGNQ